MGDIAEIVGGGTPKSSEPSYWGGEITWLTPTEVVAQEGRVITSSKRTITEGGLRESSAKLLPPGAVLLTTRATIGAAAIAGCHLATNQGFQSLVPGPDIDPHFLMYWCLSNKSEFISRAGGNTFLEISKTNLRAVPIILPPLVEQRRIVDLAQSLGQVRDAQRRAAESAGLLVQQAIRDFSQGTASVPLAECVSIARAGGTPNRNRPEYFGGHIPWLKSGEVDNPQILRTEETITEDGLAASSAWLVPAGYVVIAMYGATAGKVGRIAAPMATNQAVLALHANTGWSDRFLFHWLSARSAAMKLRATGAAQPNLSKKTVLEEPVPKIPLDDQERISDLLDSLVGYRVAANRTAKKTGALQRSVLTSLLSGEHEIPESYDELLRAV